MSEGKKEILLGDCLELMKDIPNGSIDMILCDLPYGTTACKWDTIIPFDKLWEQYERIIKPNGAIVLTASQPFTSALVMSNPKMFKYEWIWEKSKASNFLLAKITAIKSTRKHIGFWERKCCLLPTKNRRETF
jgi:site-specific DNA-methyltransferase (adenine-specific)